MTQVVSADDVNITGIYLYFPGALLLATRTSTWVKRDNLLTKRKNSGGETA